MKKTLIIIVLTFIAISIFSVGSLAKAAYVVPVTTKNSLVEWWGLNDTNNKIYNYFPDKPIPESGVIGNASYFNGNSCIEFMDNDSYSIGKNGLTVSYWIKPKLFNFEGEAEGYVHFLGKNEWGIAPNYEWVFRLYNDKAWDSVSRSKRISFYVFNLTGGLGVGSYFQDDLKEDEWIHVVGVANGTHTLIYKNGILRDKDAYKPGLNGFVDIVPKNGNAPLRIGCADRESSFKGSLDEVMIFNRALSSEEIKNLYKSFNETLPEEKILIQNLTENLPISKPVDFYPNSQNLVALRISNDKNLILQGLGTDTITINDLLRIAPRSTAPICNAEKEGIIYYDSLKKKFFGCDSISWKSLY
ncbi:MAG: LamG domain-containing protein [Candidatus Pacearchaeota archaeon]